MKLTLKELINKTKIFQNTHMYFNLQIIRSIKLNYQINYINYFNKLHSKIFHVPILFSKETKSQKRKIK